MNEKLKHPESVESKIAAVGEWIKNIGEQQKVGEIPVGILRDVLTHFGADFENLSEETRESLHGYSEAQRGLGAKAVWGENFVSEYKTWVNSFIEKYETDTGLELPALGNKKNPEKSTKRKNSGMMQFLYDLTSFASGECDFETFRLYEEGRAKNGLIHEENQKRKNSKKDGDEFVDGEIQEKIRIKVPTADEPILLSSFPPELPEEAWNWICARKAA
jgi:hypothetical protein